MDKFQFTKIYKFCNYSPNLKTWSHSVDRLLFKEIYALLQNLPKENLIIAGDFNIKLCS